MRKGFTLIELLVVIAIVSLLMSILMPAMSAVRDYSKQIICQSNLRQLVLANIGYCNEYDGHFVPAASDMYPRGENRRRWHGVRESDDDEFDVSEGPLHSYLLGGGIKECPAMKDFHKGDDWNSSFEKGCGGFGYNMVFLGSLLWKGGGIENYTRTSRIVEVKKPGGTLMFSDSGFVNSDGQVIEYSFAEPRYSRNHGSGVFDRSTSPSIHFRHRGSADVGWVDGHVSSEEMSDLENQSPGYASHQIGWLEPLDNTFFDLK